MTEMTSFPVGGPGTSETPVEGQPLLTSEVLMSDDIRRSPALPSTLASLGRDFYCKCICDPLIKLKYTVPLSAVKLCLLCLAATIVLISLTMLEIVGAHRQGELQHALKERHKYRNFSQANHHHHHHQSHPTALRQYDHSPHLTKLTKPEHQVANNLNTLNTNSSTNSNSSASSTAIQDVNLNNSHNTSLVDTSPTNVTDFTQEVIKAVGADKMAATLLNHIETVSNVSKKIANHLKGAFT